MVEEFQEYELEVVLHESLAAARADGPRCGVSGGGDGTAAHTLPSADAVTVSIDRARAARARDRQVESTRRTTASFATVRARCCTWCCTVHLADKRVGGTAEGTWCCTVHLADKLVGGTAEHTAAHTAVHIAVDTAVHGLPLSSGWTAAHLAACTATCLPAGPAACRTRSRTRSAHRNSRGGSRARAEPLRR
eukprot:364561-Chlamydomonas_euryale.AAC.4